MAESSSSANADRGVHVCSVADVPGDTGLQVDVDGIEAAVFQCSDGIKAVSNLCPHKAGPLSEAGRTKVNMEGETSMNVDVHESNIRGDVDGENCTVACPWHGWRFDLNSGEFQIDSDKRVRTFDVTVEDGEVYVSA